MRCPAPTPSTRSTTSSGPGSSPPRGVPGVPGRGGQPAGGRRAAGLTTAVPPPADLRGPVLQDITAVRPLPPPTRATPADYGPDHTGPASTLPRRGGRRRRGRRPGRHRRHDRRAALSDDPATACRWRSPPRPSGSRPRRTPSADPHAAQRRRASHDRVAAAQQGRRDDRGPAPTAGTDLRDVDQRRRQGHGLGRADDRRRRPPSSSTATPARRGAGITVEPAGGSERPTSEPIALFGFANA